MLTTENVEKPVWVFLDGWASHASLWQTLVEALDMPHPSLCIDLKNPITDDPDKLIASISHQLPDSAILVGWSLGGMLALQLAHRWPEKVKGVITLASNLRFVERADWPSGLASNTFEQFYQNMQSSPRSTLKRFCALQSLGDKHRKRVNERLVNSVQLYLSESGAEGEGDALLAQLRLLNHIDNTSLIQNLTVPQLHIFGKNDALVPAVAPSVIATRCMEAWAEVAVLDTAGHAPHVSDPVGVAGKITRFLDKTGIQRLPQRNKKAIAQGFNRAAKTYDSVASLQVRVANHLFAHLASLYSFNTPEDSSLSLGNVLNDSVFNDSVSKDKVLQDKILQDKVLQDRVLQDRVCLDLGAGTGFCTRKLKSYGADVVALDIAESMLQHAKSSETNAVASAQWLCADMDNIPVQADFFDCVFSSLCLQWSPCLEQTIAEALRVLKPGGYLVFSTLGPQTLWELKAAWREIDGYAHVNDFLNLEAWLQKDIPTQCRLVGKQCVLEPVIFDHVIDLMKSLKLLGAKNIRQNLKPSFTTRSQIDALNQAYIKVSGSDGESNKIRATYDVFYVVLQKK